jgi:hypothetical protein
MDRVIQMVPDIKSGLYDFNEQVLEAQREAESRAGALGSKYQEALRRIPQAGSGCNPALLSAARHGRNTGRSPDEVFAEIKRSIPGGGTREVKDSEIWRAVNKAFDTDVESRPPSVPDKLIHP